MHLGDPIDLGAPHLAGPQPKNDPLIPPVTVHLGDDQPGYALQSHAVHRKIPETWSGVPTDVDHQRYQWGLSEVDAARKYPPHGTPGCGER